MKSAGCLLLAALALQGSPQDEYKSKLLALNKASAAKHYSIGDYLSSAMSQLTEAVGEDVPTFEEVRTKIERRLARAQAASELGGTTVDTKMLEVQHAQLSAAAQARLGALRSELGLRSPPALQAPEET